ncbi:MAG: RHS repeat-associated core domain-containing protein [Verrucomicrobiota bacterium]
MPSLRLLALSAVLLAPHIAFSAYNPNPDECCKCVIVEIGQGDAKQALSQKPGNKPIQAAKEATGNYSFSNLNVSVNPDCQNVEITSVTLHPKGRADTSCDEPFMINSSGGYSVNISGFKVRKAETAQWEIVVKCSLPIPCRYPVKIGCDDSCSSCQETCYPSASNGCLVCNIPVGATHAGDANGILRFFTPDLSNPGIRGIVDLLPSSFTVNRDGTGRITSVVSPVNTIVLTPAGTVSDTNAFTITHKHTATGTPFRITTFSRVMDDGVTYLRVDSSLLAENGMVLSTFRHQQSQPDPNTFILDSGFVVNNTIPTKRTESLAISSPAPGTEIHRETVNENSVTVSDIETRWENFAWGWEQTQEVIDPSTANLASSWTFYQPGESTTSGFGLLKQYLRYDGYEEVHTYQFNGDNDTYQVQLPFAADPQGLSLTRVWSSTNSELTTTRKVNGNIISEEIEAFNDTSNSITTTTRTSAGAHLTTITTFMPYGSDFGGQPVSITHADGTYTAYTYSRQTGGGKTITMTTTGADNLGKSTTTNYNRSGNIIRQITSTVEYTSSVDIEHSAVTAVDAFGRPTETAHFPSNSAVVGEQASATSPQWITSTAYTCCGISSSTDRHGVVTSYEYDGLRRKTKATTLGVTTETVYNGLTTDTHRYIGAGPANTGNRISSRTRNLAGIETSSSSPDPSSTTAGALVATTTATTYQPAAGLSSRTVTTVPGAFTQISDTYLDGRIYKSTGALQPDMIYGYTVNGTGLLTTQAYLINATTTPPTTSELNSTQTDWAGRTVQTDAGGITHNYAYFGTGTTVPAGTKGQLKSVTDADIVVTLYAYNALGERTTTATSLTGSDTINYGTDQITVTETKPFTRPNSGPAVLRTTTRVWRDTDSGEDGGIVASTTDRTPDGLDFWSQQAGHTETHSTSSSITTIGLNFCDDSALSQISGAPADGLANWTDSWLVLDGNNSVKNFFENGTDAPLVNGGPVRVSWLSSNGGFAGSNGNNEQALYRKYLADGQTDPSNTDFDGGTSDGIGVRVKITGLSDWLAAHGHKAYQIRIYSSSDSANSTFQPATIHEGNATGTPIGTIQPAVMGQADYPAGLGGNPAPRGYGDSPATLTSNTITLTIPVGTPAIRGSLAAIKIIGLGTATTPATAPLDGSWVESSMSPDQTRTVTSYSGGRPLTVTRYGSDNATLTSVIQGFDSLGRPAYTIDSRTGVTTTTYISATCDAVNSVTDPGGRTTSFTYDSRGNRLTLKHPDNSVTCNRYNSKNQLEATWGSLAYATVYSYDYAGRMLTLGTNPTIANGAPLNNTGALTTWNYFVTTGRLQSKLDNSSNGPAYTYTSAGRLKKRTWARNIATDYYYNQAGQLRAVDYSDATPDVLCTRDRLGRIKTIFQGTLTFPDGVLTIATPIRSAIYGYDDTDFHLATEALDYGSSFTKTLSRYTDSTGRPRSLKVGTDYTSAYGFDDAGRLKQVWDHPVLTGVEPAGNPSFTYGYVNSSNGLVETVVGPAHTVTNTWEPTRDVLASKVNAITANSVPSSFAYGVNAIGQRKTVSPIMASGLPVSTYTPKWAWDYNDQGELIEAADQAGSNNRAFQYDGIGNRKKTVNGLLNALPKDDNWTANPLNQYTGTPLAATAPVYDADGNLTEDRGANNALEDRQYVWDAENRLVAVNKVLTRDGGGVITATNLLVSNQYDHFSRRIARTTTADTTRYLYDGWNLIAEYSGTSLAKSYTWGMDLSGSMQGAGGVGGLLAVNDGTATYYPTFDGNGNVSEYLNSDGSVAAHFEYDPFGNTVVSTGLAAQFNYRFSTKPLDSLTGLYYYGYRYLDPLTGRWMSKDPIDEEGGLNLYGFVYNDSLAWDDYLGREPQAPSQDINHHWHGPPGPAGGFYVQRPSFNVDPSNSLASGAATRDEAASAAWNIGSAAVGVAEYGVRVMRRLLDNEAYGLAKKECERMLLNSSCKGPLCNSCDVSYMRRLNPGGTPLGREFAQAIARPCLKCSDPRPESGISGTGGPGFPPGMTLKIPASGVWPAYYVNVEEPWYLRAFWSSQFWFTVETECIEL